MGCGTDLEKKCDGGPCHGKIAERGLEIIWLQRI